jgi:hypothetical protein
MDLSTVLADLYESELNCSISSFWDNNWDVKLGDEMNGFVAEDNVRTPAEATEFLHKAALKHFPTSGYAKRHLAKA